MAAEITLGNAPRESVKKFGEEMTLLIIDGYCGTSGSVLSTYYTDLGTIKIISFVPGTFFESFTYWRLVRIRILNWSVDLGIRSTGLVSESTVRICFRIPFFRTDLNTNPYRNYGSGF